MHVGKWATNPTLKLMFLSALHPLPPHYLTKEGGGLGTKIYREVRFSHIRRNASNYKPFHFQGLDNLLWNLIIVGGEDREFDCNQYRDPSPTPTQIPVNGGGSSVPGPVYMHVGKYATKLVLYLQMFLCAFHPLLKLSKKRRGFGHHNFREVRFSHICQHAFNTKPFHF